MAKPATLQIKLVSTADTGYFYVTKDPRTKPEKLEVRKYDEGAQARLFLKRKLSNHWAGFDLDRPTFDTLSISAAIISDGGDFYRAPQSLSTD